MELGDEDQKSRAEQWQKKRESGLERLNKRGRERPAILQLSGRYGSHEAAQPDRKQRAQGKVKDKQGQWFGGGFKGGRWRESEDE